MELRHNGVLTLYFTFPHQGQNFPNLWPGWKWPKLSYTHSAGLYERTNRVPFLTETRVAFDVCWTVHHCDNRRIKNQLDATYYFIVLLIGSTCFGHYYAHHHAKRITTININKKTLAATTKRQRTSHHLLTYLLTYSMVQSPSWAANWFAASQEIPRISRNPKVHYRTLKRPPPVSILGQPNPVHIPTSHSHPNIIHPSTPRSPQWSLSLRFPHQDPIYTPSPHSYAPHAQPISFFSILSPAQYWVSSTYTTKNHNFTLTLPPPSL